MIDIVDLSLAHESADGEVGASLVPVDTGDAVALIHLAEVGHLLRRRRVNIHGAAQTHR